MQIHDQKNKTYIDDSTIQRFDGKIRAPDIVKLHHKLGLKDLEAVISFPARHLVVRVHRRAPYIIRVPGATRQIPHHLLVLDIRHHVGEFSNLEGADFAVRPENIPPEPLANVQNAPRGHALFQAAQAHDEAPFMVRQIRGELVLHVDEITSAFAHQVAEEATRRETLAGPFRVQLAKLVDCFGGIAGIEKANKDLACPFRADRKRSVHTFKLLC